MQKLFLPNQKSYSKKRDTEIFQTSLIKGYKKKLRELAKNYGYNCINYFLEDMVDASFTHSINAQDEIDSKILEKKILDNYEKNYTISKNEIELLVKIMKFSEDEYINDTKFTKVPFTTRELGEKLGYSRTHISSVLRAGGFVYFSKRKGFMRKVLKT